MEQTEQLINFGEAYIDAISKLKEDQPKDVANVLSMLNCIHPDNGYRLGIYIEEPSPEGAVTHKCDQSWFHCYQGDEEHIMRRPYNSKIWKDGDSDNALYLRFTFEMFDYLSIDATPMGAWQTYLLCISKTLLPFSGGLYYTNRKLIFKHNQLENLGGWTFFKRPKIENITEDLAPSVMIDGRNCVVSCCFWNDWEGLIREELHLTFNDNGRVKIGNFYEKAIYKYYCGVRF